MTYRAELDNKPYHINNYSFQAWKEIENKFPFLERIQDAIWPLLMRGDLISYEIKENILSLKFLKNFDKFDFINYIYYSFSKEVVLDLSDKKICCLQGVKLYTNY